MTKWLQTISNGKIVTINIDHIVCYERTVEGSKPHKVIIYFNGLNDHIYVEDTYEEITRKLGAYT